MTKASRERFLSRMREAVADIDREAGHVEADNILVEYLEELGETEIIGLWVDGTNNWRWA